MSRTSPLASPSAEAEVFAFQHSSPLSLRQQSFSSPPAPPLDDPAQIHDYNFSSEVYDESTSGAESEDQLTSKNLQEPGFLDMDRRISGCSSISSFPASSIQLPTEYERYDSPRTPTRQEFSVAPRSFDKPGGSEYQLGSPRSAREFHSAFRRPSSVRALQMRDEVMSETRSVLHHHRRSGSQMSSYSQRSSYSTSTSPTKRSGRSHRGSPQKPSSHLQKEFPLVLLHCTLLPPTLLPHLSIHDDTRLGDLLPEEYKKRWIMLREKLIDDVEVQSRGILIPHPREDYELLEERLLETLELENPRIHHNHFFQKGSNSGDSGFESGGTSDDEGDQDISSQAKCLDCGRNLDSEKVGRKWEVKVYAANGLMRSGAWGAAWQEMEKVDVEIRVSLPEVVRKDLEAKWLALASSNSQPEVEQPDLEEIRPNEAMLSDSREREVYGESGRSRSQAEIDGFSEEPRVAPDSFQEIPTALHTEHNLQSLLVQASRKFSQDRKNILVGVLSFLVLFFAFVAKEQPEKGSTIAQRNAPAHHTEILTTTVTATTVAISTETITTSLNKEIPVSSVTISAIESAPDLTSESTLQTEEQSTSTSITSTDVAVETRASPEPLTLGPDP